VHASWPVTVERALQGRHSLSRGFLRAAALRSDERRDHNALWKMILFRLTPSVAGRFEVT